jgi:iron complex transport system substrate-binding protein
MKRQHVRNPSLVIALALIVAACGDDATTTTAAPTTSEATTIAPTTSEATPTTVATTTTTAPQSVEVVGDDGATSTITDTSRIVSLSGDLTEIVFALGEGERVVAIDVTTTFPPEAAALPQVGFGQQLAPEPVLAFQPTVVLANELTAPRESIDQLRAAGIPVVVLAGGADFDQVTHKILTVAQVLGMPEEGATLAASVGREIEAATSLAATAATMPRVAFVYSRGPQLLLLFGTGMGTNPMITGANAIDAGAETGVFGAVPLAPEMLIATAPDVIVVPEAGLQALGGFEALAKVPGVAQTPAGENQAFLAYDEAYFFNLGPRVGQALMAFVLDLHPELETG